MKLWKTIDIADNERGLLFRRNRLDSILQPGRHRISAMAGKVRCEVHDITKVMFLHSKAKFLLSVHADKMSAHIEKYELNDHQVGLLYRDGHLVDLLTPGSFHAVWKGVEDVRVELIDIADDYAVDKALVGLIGRGAKLGQVKTMAQSVHYVEIADEHIGMLTVNGKFASRLEAGSYAFWKFNRSITVKLVDLRLQGVDVSGQEILTKDRVSLRINLSATYKVVDPEIAALKLNDYASFIYRELQLKLRESVGTKTLDELLADKDSLNHVVTDGIREVLSEYGIEVKSVGVKDVILPGDMKLILNKVVEAQKEAEANLIKRREETQSVRALHNTAKLMENNSVLLRLKELESLERITGQIDKITVYGGLDGVMNDLVKLGARA